MVVKIQKNLLMFALGGSIYIVAEMLWRYIRGSNPTQWVMFVIGGIAMVVIDHVNTYTRDRLNIAEQVYILTGFVTLLEFVSGVIVNIWLGMNVWDYSNQPFNIFGQVCVPYIGLWALLVIVAIWIDEILLQRIFGYNKRRDKMEEKDG